jgi:hypothetical protein
MPLLGRAVAGLILLAVAAFAIFGFLATFEVREPARQHRWRLLYGTIGLACGAGVVWLVRTRKP